ncbi:MAG: alpha/beta hydrolase [Sandaracinaceae bacterium]|nr:alpha/beta hydrolase [Sandaracinaceae bacterium]
MRAPFQQLPFDEVPERPRRAHGYFQTEAREIDVRSDALGPVRVHVRVHGRGPPLLLLHGFMTSSYSWRYVLPSLGASHTLFMPDLPGAGRSDKPRGPYTPRAMAEHLVALIDALGIRGSAAIGNSLGGYLLMHAALSDPGAMSCLVNLHSPGVATARMRALRVATRAVPAPWWQGAVGALVRRDPERWVHRNVHYFDETLKSREEHREYAAPLRDPRGLAAFLRMLVETLDAREMDELGRSLARAPFPIPLQLVYARRDPMVPPVVGRRLHALVPSAELVWLDQASHFAHVDATERFVSTATPFLARHGASRS